MSDRLSSGRKAREKKKVANNKNQGEEEEEESSMRSTVERGNKRRWRPPPPCYAPERARLFSSPAREFNSRKIEEHRFPKRYEDISGIVGREEVKKFT